MKRDKKKKKRRRGEASRQQVVVEIAGREGRNSGTGMEKDKREGTVGKPDRGSLRRE